MRNRISIVMLVFALMVFSLFGCQSREVPASIFPDPSKLAQANENSEPSPENALEEKLEPVLPVDEPPAEPTIPAAPDYYFMGSLYGMGDSKAVVKGKCEVLSAFLFNAAPEAATIEPHPVKRIKIDIPPVTSQISQEKAFEMLAKMGFIEKRFVKGKFKQT